MAVNEKIRSFIQSELLWQGAVDELDDDTLLIEAGVVDSLGIVRLVSFVESEFGISVGDTELLPEHFESIRTLSDFVEEKQTS
jgi:acyl carrier protein